MLPSSLSQSQTSPTGHHVTTEDLYIPPCSRQDEAGWPHVERALPPPFSARGCSKNPPYARRSRVTLEIQQRTGCREEPLSRPFGAHALTALQSSPEFSHFTEGQAEGRKSCPSLLPSSGRARVRAQVCEDKTASHWANQPRAGSYPWFSDLAPGAGLTHHIWHFLLINTLPCTERLL